MDGREQAEQPAAIGQGLRQPAGQHVVAIVCADRSSAEAAAASFQSRATVARNASRSLIRSASSGQLEVGGVGAPFEHLALEAVVGGVAVGDVLVGRAEQVRPLVVVFLVVVGPLPGRLADQLQRGTCQYSSALASR